MAENGADFTLTFRGLCAAAEGPESDGPVRALFNDGTAYDEWAARWRDRLAAEPMAPAGRAATMRTVNPAVIPRNHLVEAAIEAAVGGDLTPFEDLLAVLQRPYEDRPDDDRHAARPEPTGRAYQTFCGT